MSMTDTAAKQLRRKAVESLYLKTKEERILPAPGMPAVSARLRRNYNGDLEANSGVMWKRLLQKDSGATWILSLSNV